MTNTNPHRERLRDLSDEAMRELPWRDLAAFIDALNEEYQHFCWLIHRREIGAGVPIAGRPQGRGRAGVEAE